MHVILAALLALSGAETPELQAASTLRPGHFAVEGSGLQMVATIYVNGRPAVVERSTDRQLIARTPAGLEGPVATIRVTGHQGITALVAPKLKREPNPMRVSSREEVGATILVIETSRNPERFDVLAVSGSFSDGSIWKEGETSNGRPWTAEVVPGSRFVVAGDYESFQEEEVAGSNETGFWASTGAGYATFGRAFDFDPAFLGRLQAGYRLSKRFSLLAEFSGFRSEFERVSFETETYTTTIPSEDPELPPSISTSTRTKTISDHVEAEGFLFLAGLEVVLLDFEAVEIYTQALAGGLRVEAGDPIEGTYLTAAWGLGARAALSESFHLSIEGRVPVTRVEGASDLGFQAVFSLEIRF